jgi:hypothetical protein
MTHTGVGTAAASDGGRAAGGAMLGGFAGTRGGWVGGAPPRADT